jgi:hypothetical protein
MGLGKMRYPQDETNRGSIQYRRLIEVTVDVNNITIRGKILEK